MEYIISDKDFDAFAKMVYDKVGIHLTRDKKQLLQSRVNKVLRKRSIGSYREYYDIINSDTSGDELVEFINLISTNVTNFFREEKHFEFLRTTWQRSFDFKFSDSVKIWSAACSSGEEPYSIAITMKEMLGDKYPFEIYATDISSKVLSIAQRGVYPLQAVDKIDKNLLKKYFQEGKNNSAGFVKVKSNIQRHVKFGRLNLIEPFTLPYHFDIIFCRNVMIYFDLQTKESIVNKFYDFMQKPSYLMIGHSESLNGTKHPFQYVQPATYKKV